MKNMDAKLKKIEQALKPEGGIVVFQVRYGHEEKDFESHRKKHIARGGNPDDVFVLVINYAGDQNHAEC